MNAETFLAEADAPPSAEDFLTDAPSAESFLDDQPGAVAGTLNEFKRGLLSGQQALVAGQLERAPKAPTMRQLRKGYVTAMSDPRYNLALTLAADDPAKLQRVEETLGPTAQVGRVESAIRLNRQFIAENVAKLEAEAQSIPASEAMTEWNNADNSNWAAVLAKNPFEITAGIMAQSFPAMAPALAATVVAPGGTAGRAIAAGAGSYGVESAHAFLDSARQTGYDFTDPVKVQEFFANPEAQAKARAYARQRGVPIAVLDALTAGLAGKFVGPVLKQGAGKVAARSVAEVGMQAAGGATGEAAAQLNTGKKLSELSAKEIVAEALGEMASGPVEAYSNLRQGRAGRAATTPPGTSAPGRPVDDELPPAPPVESPVIPEPTTENARNVPGAAVPTAAAPEQSAAVPPPPVPEDPRTITAQMQMLVDGKRSAVLITEGEAMPIIPEGDRFATVELEGYGTMIYNKRLHKEETILQRAKEDKLGRILGYGVDRKPKPGTEVGVVTVRDPEGVEKQAVVTSQEDLPKVVAAAEKVADKEDTVQLEPAAQVIAQRQQANPHEVASAEEFLSQPEAAEKLTTEQELARPNRYRVEMMSPDGTWYFEAHADTLPKARKEAARRAGSTGLWRVVPDYGAVTRQTSPGSPNVKVIKPAVPHAPPRLTPEFASYQWDDYDDQLTKARQILEKAIATPYNPEAIAEWRRHVQTLENLLKENRAQHSQAPRLPAPPAAAAGVTVTARHLAEARAALEVDRPPDVRDDIEGQVTSGPVRFPEADFRNMLDTVRDELAQAQFKKPYKKLRKEQRTKVDAAHRMSVTEGVPADEVLRGIASANPKYDAWTVDDLAEALSQAPTDQPKDSKQVQQLAREIAEAEAGVTDAEADSAIESWADETIAASQGRMNLGLDPELLLAYGIKGAAMIARGVRDFAAWSAAMVQEFGEDVRPHLQDIFARAQRRLAAIKAHHGTPHKIVGRFTTDKIGTGEGAQVYGWGLYFAENEKVAENYARTLSANMSPSEEQLRAYFKPGEIVSGYGGHDRVRAFNWNGGNWRVEVESVQRKADGSWETDGPPRTHFTSPSAKDLRSRGIEGASGRKYTVTLNVKPEELLDWDKPIIEQSSKVIAALAKAKEKLDRAQTLFDPTAPKAAGQGFYNALSRSLGIPIQDTASWTQVTSQVFRGDEMIGSDKNASEYLRSLGIKGIRYADQGSRFNPKGFDVSPRIDGKWVVKNDVGEFSGGAFATKAEAEKHLDSLRTYNYVIFDDSTIDITHENEKPIDPIEAALDRAIAATNLDRTQTLEGITGAPVWLTKSALNGLLRIIRATYRGTKNLAQAVQAGIEWLRAQNLPNYSETEIKTWLERNITTRPDDDDLNVREFQDQLDEPEAGEPDIGRQVGNLLYQRRTNESDAAFAARIMQAVGGPAAAVDVFTDATNGMPGSVRMLLGQLIIKALGVAGQHQAAARFYDETFAAHVTNIAQALQSLNAWLSLTPEGKVIWARRKIERAAEDLIAPVRPVLAETKQQLDETNRAGIEETTAAPDVQAAARAAVDAGLEKQAGTPGTELAEAIRKQVLDTLIAAGLLTEREAEIFRLHLEGTADNSTLAEKLQRAGIPLHDKRAKAINDLYKAKTETERKKIRAAAQKARKQQSADPNAAIDKAIRKAMKELRVMLGQIIREHHTKAEAVGQSLAEKIAAASGLTEADAKKLAEAVQKRFAEIITKRKRAALEKMLKPITATGLGKRTLVDKLIAMSNLGALTEEQFWNAVRTNLNLPTWSNDLADRIRKQVDALERIPEDQTERKQKAQIELLNTIERAKGVDAYDLAISFYITNILTGITTHMKNVGSTFLNASGAIGGEVLRSVASGRLDDIPLALEAIGQGVKRGKLAAGDVLRTGVVTGTRLTKMEPGRTLELTQFGRRGGVPAQGIIKTVLENRLAALLNLWKYNFRLMAAEDLMFFKPAEEVKAALLSKRIARSEGLRGEAAQDRARQLLGYGRQATASAQAQATREGFTGSAAARRAAEILNAGRPVEIREDAQQFALRTTFNGEPYGALGFVAHLINQAKAADNRKIRLGANLIAPFTNIIANVVNESLNYTPIGVLRARWQGKELLGYAKAKLTPTQEADLRAELYSKALIGTALLTAVALKAAADLDDKDPDFAIYGAGPANQNDRQGLEAKKWIAHSIKLGDRYYSYANTPLAIPLAWLGNIYDRMRDARLFGNRSAQRTADSLPLMAASSAIGMVKVMTEQSFMTGLMQLSETLSEPSPEIGGRSLVRLGLRTAGSFVVPNAVQQLDRAFDPAIYQQRDATAMLVNGTPFLRGAQGLPAVNALGLPVTRPLSQTFTSSQADAPALVKFLAESGNWPSMPDRNHIYPRTGRTMNDAEYYNYVKGAGALAYARLDGMLQAGTLAGYKDATTRAKVIAEYIESSRKQWRSQNGW